MGHVAFQSIYAGIQHSCAVERKKENQPTVTRYVHNAKKNFIMPMSLSPALPHISSSFAFVNDASSVVFLIFFVNNGRSTGGMQLIVPLNPHGLKMSEAPSIRPHLNFCTSVNLSVSVSMLE
jgi:hypothetical protein